MVVVSADDLLWSSLDPCGEHRQIDENKLTELCIQELLKNTSLLTTYLPRLPNQIHAVILSSAVAQNNTFIIKQLMQWCPCETITLPVLNALKTFYTISHENKTDIEKAYEDFTGLTTNMLSVFFSLIENNDTDSQLRCLDFCNIPIGVQAFTLIKSFISRTTVLSRQCTLKCTAVVSKSTDVFLLTYCIEKANAVGLKLAITGIFFCRQYFPDVAVINLLEHLSEMEVELILINYSIFVPSIEPFCAALNSFKHIKCLNLSHSVHLNSETHLRTLASALTEFHFLERLVLKGNTLTGWLSRLFQEFCKKDLTTPPDSKCCVLHNGTLEYLDISACCLVSKDIEVLRELALKNSLKHLNISENSLEMKSTCETLLSQKSSLCVLVMDYCFHGRVEYDPIIFPLSGFKKLKYLSMKGLEMTELSKASLEREKMQLPKPLITVT